MLFECVGCVFDCVGKCGGERGWGEAVRVDDDDWFERFEGVQSRVSFGVVSGWEADGVGTVGGGALDLMWWARAFR